MESEARPEYIVTSNTYINTSSFKPVNYLSNWSWGAFHGPAVWTLVGCCSYLSKTRRAFLREARLAGSAVMEWVWMQGWFWWVQRFKWFQTTLCHCTARAQVWRIWRYAPAYSPTVLSAYIQKNAYTVLCATLCADRLQSCTEISTIKCQT